MGFGRLFLWGAGWSITPLEVNDLIIIFLSSLVENPYSI